MKKPTVKRISRAHISHGASKAKRSVAPSSSPSSLAHSRQLRAKGPKMSSLLQRAIYFSVINSQKASDNADVVDQRIQDLNGTEVSPNWQGDQTALSTTSLESASDGQSSGAALLSGEEAAAESDRAPR